MRAVLAIGLVAAAATGCSLLPAGCPEALAQGRLAPDGEGGAFLQGESGKTRVRWPDGYRVVQEPELQLRGPFGNLIASEGDTVYVGGGFAPGDEVFVACGYVSRDPP
jgi:hypothetical protein